MLTKRTEQEILDDLKKIDGSVYMDVLREQATPLINEWLQNEYLYSQIFHLGDNFQGCDEQAKDFFSKEFTIIDWSIEMGNLSKDTQTLVKEGLDPKITCSGGRTTAMFVAQNASQFLDAKGKLHADKLKKCADFGIDKNAVDESGRTALDYLLTMAGCQKRESIEEWSPELKELLQGFSTGEALRSNVDKRLREEILDDFKKIDGEIESGQFMGEVLALTEKWTDNGYDLNAKFSLGENFKGYRQDMNEKGQPIGEKFEYFSKEFTVLDVVCMIGHPTKAVETLIAEGLNPNVKTSSGRTTLMFLAQTPFYFYYSNDAGAFLSDRIKKCLDLGIDRNAVDHAGKTALDYIMETLHCKILEELIANVPALKDVLQGFLTGAELRLNAGKRSREAILADFKKIDGRVGVSSLMKKGKPLIEEWIENGYEHDAIFSLGDKFFSPSAKKLLFP